MRHFIISLLLKKKIIVIGRSTVFFLKYSVDLPNVDLNFD